MRLAELRRLVSIEEVLSRRGLTAGLVRRGHRLIGPCPVHGGDSPTAFVADCHRGIWNCFTRCRGGDVIELVRALDGSSYAEVARTLAAMAGQAPRSEQQPPRPAPSAASFLPYTRRLTLDPHHPLLADRGIRPETARRFEVGAWHGHGMLAGCVGVRLHDPQGRPLGCAGRRLMPDARGKWVFPRGLPKASLLYGWHRLPPSGDLVVVEGAWEVLRLHQLGVPAVALLGTACSRDQAALLSGRRPWLLLDGDESGQAAARHLARWLGAPLLTVPPGRDPADLDDPQLVEILGPLFFSNQPPTTTVPKART